jgi:hypothetical protein
VTGKFTAKGTHADDFLSQEAQSKKKKINKKNQFTPLGI